MSVYTATLAKNGQTYYFRDGRRVKASEAKHAKSSPLTYEDLLRDARRSLSQHQSREKRLAQMEIVADDQECESCRGGKAHKEAALCRGCALHLLGNIDTNPEPCMKGKWLKKMVELNRYIFTTSSTNEPQDPTFERMVLTFFLPAADALALAKWLPKDYDNLTCPSKTAPVSSCKYRSLHKSIEYMVPGFLSGANKGKDCGYCWRAEWPSVLGPEYDHLNLSFMAIEDPVMERRTLYDVLLRYFKSKAKR